MRTMILETDSTWKLTRRKMWNYAHDDTHETNVDHQCELIEEWMLLADLHRNYEC